MIDTDLLLACLNARDIYSEGIDHEKLNDDHCSFANGYREALDDIRKFIQGSEQVTVPNYVGMVREFHETFEHFVNDKPTLMDKSVQGLRYSLIKEEVDELLEALQQDDIVEVADALADILYVTFGACLVFGIPIDRVFELVQQSNMSKLGEDGKPIYREDGKIMKGPRFFEPQPFIKALLDG